jgi:hypothetical protein
MSKRVGVAVISIIFLVALVSAVPVDAKKGFSVHRWWSEVYYNFDPAFTYEWKGDIWTEDGKHGTIYWDNTGVKFLGPEGSKEQKFWGVWWIDWDDEFGGGYIEGTHDGSFTYAIMQCTINGRITETSDDWSYLDGRKIHTVSYVDFGNFVIEHYLQIN